MTRYAIYVVPDGPLRTAGETWLAHSDVSIGRRRYGFHGTLKAPFRLAPGRTAGELTDRLVAFAKRYEPVVAPALALGRLNDLFALVSEPVPPALRALADAVVLELDDLRAPATAAEIARRRPDRLEDREREHLYAYGYPYVLDCFRFHLTLTDPVPFPQANAVDTALRSHFGAFIGSDLVIRSLNLFVEPALDRPFELVSTHRLIKGRSADG